MKAIPRRRLLLAALALPAMAARAQQAPPLGLPAEVAAALPGARLQGVGRMRFMLMHIYDARLWVGVRALGADWSATPFALELEYARDLKGADIAERSLAEMRRQGEIPAEAAERWLGIMKQLFPDVRAGDRITGVNLPGLGARFFVNGVFRGEPREPEFARTFFGIWLSPRTSEPALRDALLGRNPP
jgi:hypothetical protein